MHDEMMNGVLLDLLPVLDQDICGLLHSISDMMKGLGSGLGCVRDSHVQNLPEHSDHKRPDVFPHEMNPGFTASA